MRSLHVLGLAAIALLAACAEVGDDTSSESEVVGHVEQALNPNPEEPEDPTGTTPTGPSTQPEYVRVMFDGLSITNEGDDSSGWLQIYGSMSVRNITRNSTAVRNLGAWGNPSGRASVGWTSSDGAAPKNFNTNAAQPGSAPHLSPMYSLYDAKICQAGTYASCLGPFEYHNNAVLLLAKPGDRLRIDFDFRDYDAVFDDQVCNGSLDGIVAADTGWSGPGIPANTRGIKVRPWGSSGEYRAPSQLYIGDNCSMFIR